jgi:hypothetical protein
MVVTPNWQLLVEYPSIELTLHGWYVDEDDTRVGLRWLVATTKWNILHPTLGNWSGCGTWCQSFSSGMRHEKQDVAWSD